MRWTGGRALFWVVLVGWLVGSQPSGLGASEDGRTDKAGSGEFVAFERGGTKPSGDGSGLERWSRVARRPRVKSADPIRLSAYGWVRIFQKFISPVDGASCSFHPSCSNYGLQAIEEHGLLFGVPMAAERIMRDHRPKNPERYPLYEKGGKFYYWDPVKSKDGGEASGP